MLLAGESQPRQFDSGPDLTAEELVSRVTDVAAGWQYDVVSIGLPGPTHVHGAREEPGNLGEGWVGFDFERAFGCSVRTVNDAVMHALGSYAGGRMLFLGLGTGVASALVAERVVIPLELGSLTYGPRETLADRLGKAGLERHGVAGWRRSLAEAIPMLQRALVVDYIVIGGGHANHVQQLPEGTRRGSSDDAFAGGFRLWEEAVEPHDRSPSGAWRIVR